MAVLFAVIEIRVNLNRLMRNYIMEIYHYRTETFLDCDACYQ